MPRDLPFEKATATEAAQALDKAPGTIYSWGTRYRARKIRIGKTAYYDLKDLRVIERETAHGHPVPATWQERAEIRLRCPLRDAERNQAAA